MFEHINKVLRHKEDSKETEILREYIIKDVLPKINKERLASFTLPATETEEELTVIAEIKVKQIVETYISRYKQSGRSFSDKKEKTPNIVVVKPGTINLLSDNENLNEKSGTGGEEIYGCYSPVLHQILIERQTSSTQFILIVFHELLHAYGYTALKYNKGKDFPGVYRSGIAQAKKQSKTTEENEDRSSFFDSLNEAIIHYMVRDFYVKESGSIDVIKDEQNNISSGDIEVEAGDDEEIKFFQTLVKKLATKYPSNEPKEKKEEDVKEIFLSSFFTGDMLRIGKLIEKSFGKGKFRELGEITSE